MSRLSERINAVEAAAFEVRANDAHHFKYKADVYSYAPGDLIASDIPIVGGTLTLDSSDPTRRQLSLEVAGEDWIPRTHTDPMAPFGQRILLYVTIDRLDGTWFPWVKLGEFPIITTSVEWPSKKVTVDCGDYSTIVNEYLFTASRAMKGKTLKDAIVQMVNESLPNAVFSTKASSHASTVKFVNYVADAGKSRWDVCMEMADRKGQEVFFDWNGDLVIRYDRTEDDEDVIAGVGPDIGTVSNPVSTISDGQTGNLVALTSTVTRRGGMNGVKFILSGQKTKTTPARWGYFTSISSGPVGWGDAFGRIPIVQQFNVNKITERRKNDYIQRANSLLRRRRGVVRYLDMDITPIYWLEPDDTVKVTWDGTTEYHYISRVTLDLSGKKAMRLRTRQLGVTDPG